MAYVRLSKSHRLQILNNLMVNRFKAEAQEFVVRERELVHLIHESLFDKKQRAAMKRLPMGWLPEVDGFGVMLENPQGYPTHEFYALNRRHFGAHGLGFMGATAHKKSEPRLRIPSSHENATTKVLIGSDLHNEVFAFHTEREGLYESFKSTKQKALAALGAATSYKQLIEEWPEVKPFCAFLELQATGKAVQSKVNLPMIPVVDLNKSLGLPI